MLFMYDHVISLHQITCNSSVHTVVEATERQIDKTKQTNKTSHMKFVHMPET